ncbi:basement membrane-specific heparan sulfate proteoglycan core protein-like [Argopecten irradians]|uniref:basement membrane-specific heparan sulfate proteoglycan core protein-like n=1 Tax=Argopecten irradians TaxID=31199 RepID=UPI0037160CF3
MEDQDIDGFSAEKTRPFGSSASYYTTVGTNITLQCTVTSSRSITNVFWQRGINGVISVLTIDNVKYSGGSLALPSLTIISTQTSDSGTYTCFGSNFNGRQSAITQLTVISGVPTVTISQAAYTVIAGQTVTLGCKVSASPPHTSVYWQRIDSGVTTTLNIDGIKYSGSTVTSPSLTITSAGSNDASDYTCSATNVVGTGTSGQTTLTVTDIPVVTVDQAQYSVITGQTITLGCTVKASPGHTSVFWQKRLHGTTMNVNIDGNKYQGSSVVNPDLTVTNTAVSDQASYTCSATNIVGTGTSTPTILTVTGSVPFVTISQAAYTVITGQTVTLGCTVSASPPHTSVYWQRIESGVATTLNIERNKYFGSTVTSPSLTITSAGSNDASDYTCLATNVVGTGTSGQTALTVTDIPVVTVDQAQYSVITGQTITLGCTVTASPGHTSVFWQKRLHGTTMNVNIDGNKYQGSSVVNPDLTVTNTAAASDQASYTCSATNIVGTGTSIPTTLTVTGSVPTVTISQAAYTVIAGQTVTLGCTVSASPPHTSVYWQRIDNGVTTTLNIDGIKYSGSTVTSPSLTITSAGSNDASDYTCSATNVVGTGTSGQTALTVTDIPVVTVDQAHYSVITGQTITLGCTVTASPDHTSVFWQKRLHGTTMNVNIDGNKYQGSSVVNPDLTVTNTAVSDQASYTCSATNIIGTGTSTPTILTVTGNVPFVTISKAAHTVITGQTVTLGCTVSASPPHTSVYWQRIDSGVTTTLNIDKIKYSGSTPTSPALTITSSSSNDASDYTCSATNVVGTGTSGQTTLTVTGNQDDGNLITIYISNQYPSGNCRPGRVLCNYWTDYYSRLYRDSFTGSHKCVLAKRLHGTTINVNIDGNKYQGISAVNPDLTVTNTSVSDQASYTCSATNIVGTGTSTPTILTVTGNVPTVTISQAAYTVITGQTVTLGCTVSASPPHTSVYWQRIDSGVTTTLNIDGIKYSGSTVISPSLTITSAGSNDASDYTCSATNAVGTGTSGQTTLTVTGGIPAVLVPQTTYEVTTGAAVTLICNVNANPTAQSVLWEKLHEILFIQVVITTNNRYAGGTVNVPSLTITDSQPPDSGTYRCSATNSVGTGTSGTLQLTVTGGIPTVSVPETHYTAVSGGTLILVCNIISNPIHTSVIWQKLVNHIYHQVEIATSSRHSGGTISSPSLQITNVQSDDSGTYRCSAANQVGTGVSSSIELQVSGSVPSVAIPQSTYSTTSGWPMTVVCIVESSQTETDVTWEKLVNDSYHNVQITSNRRYSGGTRHVPSLFISSALTSDSGSYRCKAENIFGAAVSGSTQLTVYGIVPRVSIIQTAYSTTTGGSVTLVCDVSADPFQTSVTWEKLVGNLYQPVSIGVNDRYSAGTPELPPLVITDSDTSDSGTYRCTVTNPVGTTSSETTQLTVNENETIELVDNNSVTLAIGISAALIMVLMIALIVLCACKWRVRKQNELVGLSDGTTSSTPPEGTGLSKTNNKSRVRGNDNSNSSAPTGSNSISSRRSTDYCRIDNISSVMLDHRAAHNRPRRDLTPHTYTNATFDTGVSDPQAYLTVINSTLSSTTRKQSSPFHRNTDTYTWKSNTDSPISPTREEVGVCVLELTAERGIRNKTKRRKLNSASAQVGEKWSNTPPQHRLRTPQNYT